jgi:HK97 family phage prohead protease
LYLPFSFSNFGKQFQYLENIYNYKTAVLSCSFKDADPKKGIVTGYFSSFGNKDSDGDVILKGAFQKTVEDRGPKSNQPRIKHLLNHRTDQPLGKILTLMEDDKGLYYESQVGSHFLGKEFIAMVEADLITEHSIGYKTIKWEKDRNDDHVMYIKEIQLWEGSSLTAWGANAQTPLTGMKGVEKETYLNSLITKQQAIEKFCSNTSISDETIESLVLHNKQLFQVIIDLTKETTEPGETTQPDNKAEGDNNWEDYFKPTYQLFKYPRDGTTRLKKGLSAYT